MIFTKYLTKSANDINVQLESLYKLWERNIGKINSNLLPLISIVIKANNGGKRLRGSLVKLGYELAGGKDQKEILKPAAAFEIFQTAILAHDDIIDQSPLRRGKPTIYKALGADHYAFSQTICLGDIGFFQALQIIAESNFPDKEKNLAIKSFVKTMIETGLGEMLDVELPHLNIEKKEADAITIFKLKTARYTLIGPLELGAILAGAKQEILDNIEQFGESLGIAFQIQDDILGVFGDEKTIGKSVTSDIAEGKNTLLIIYALKQASPEQRKLLGKFYGNPQVDERGLDEVRKVFKDTQALEYSRQKALEYVSRAKKFITQVTKDKGKQQLLMEMADFLVERTS
ncbi:polyprenyl synthetase family protein [Candidatus Daviesbacteria bacterium]|nr:polyprenyl synthetase family protein [Candidatus Daviesbacteria bacterium]